MGAGHDAMGAGHDATGYRTRRDGIQDTTSFPRSPAVIPAKAGIWMRACLRCPLQRPGAEDRRARSDEQAAGKEE